jgi:hypothetical protein
VTVVAGRCTAGGREGGGTPSGEALAAWAYTVGYPSTMVTTPRPMAAHRSKARMQRNTEMVSASL